MKKHENMFRIGEQPLANASSTVASIQGSKRALHFTTPTIQALLDFADLRNVRRIEIVDSGSQSVLHTIARVRSTIKALSKIVPEKSLISTSIVIKTDRLSWHELSILRKRYSSSFDVDVGKWRIPTNEGVPLFLVQTQLRDLSRRLKSGKPTNLTTLTKHITTLSQASKPDYSALNRLYLHRAALATDRFLCKSIGTYSKAKSWEEVAAMEFIEPYLSVAEASLLSCGLAPGAHGFAMMNAVLLQVVQPLPLTSPWRK
jgi:hypothetical protein